MWIGPVTEGAVEFTQHRFTETPGKARPRQAAQITQGVQTHALHGFLMLMAGAEQPHWRGVEGQSGAGQIGAMQFAVHARQQRSPQRNGELAVCRQ